MSNQAEKFSKSEIEQLALQFEESSVEEILEWAVERFSTGLVMTSNFGPSGVVMIDYLARIAPEVPVIYLNTGFQFAETDRLKERLLDRYHLNLIERGSSLSVAEQNRIHGEKLYARDSDLCCQIRKVEPLQQALAGYDAWIAALRRDQSSTRAGIGKVEWNARHGLVKINPLATWTRNDVWNYILRHGIPYNPLHDDGYASIGCEPCTKRVAPGAHERSGRWEGQQKVECGIHL